MSKETLLHPPTTQDGLQTLGATEATDTHPTSPSATRVTPGTLVGRYVILSKLGAGAMGVVFAAYDPELDRKVAMKLLSTPGSDRDLARTRLQREAQALAKLDHPNVVSVYDVGLHGGQLFVSMEFVEGQTLGAWMNAVVRPRPWKEVLRVFTAAGRGLAAAHEVGLVHRDFKPENVMLGADGRVRVMDFGLARAEGDLAMDDMRESVEELFAGDEAEATSSRFDSGGKQLLVSPLTQTGTMLGTPAYMSFEQFAGKLADARSDQFAFCTSLYEALYGERPFAGESLYQLLQSVERGELRPAPKGSTVPGWLRAVLLRGLATKADDRWPSMQLLLEALADDPALRRRKWWRAAAVLGLLGAGAWGFWQALPKQEKICEGFEDRLAGVWDASRRAEVRAAIEGTQLSYAPGTWVRVEHHLDEYTRRWVAARQQACEATHEGEQSGEMLDRRMACLDERLQHVLATVDLLAQADEEMVSEAVEAALGLPSLDRCADAQALMAEHPLPEDPKLARQVVALEEQLVKAQGLERMGKFAQGLVLVEAMVGEAEQLGYGPLTARVLLQRGLFERELGEYEDAEKTLENAYEAAVGLRMVDEAAAAAAELVLLTGVSLARHEDGRRWGLHASALAEAAGTKEASATLLDHLGLVATSEGKYEDARRYHQRALEIREQTLGPEHLAVAVSLHNLGHVARSQGKPEDARRYYERALAIKQEILDPEHPSVAASFASLGNLARSEGKHEEARHFHERALEIKKRALGPEHPSVASSYNSLGNVAMAGGKYEDARAYYDKALAIREQTLGPSHPKVAAALHNLGTVALAQGAHEDARAYFERALKIREEVLGPEHPAVAATLNNLAAVAIAQGELEEARHHHERARALLEQVLGPEHPEVAISLHNLGCVVQAEGDLGQALEIFERALAMLELALGPEHPQVAIVLTSIGLALLEDDKPAEALAPLERALAIRSVTDEDPIDLATTHFALARALWEAPATKGRDRPRARTLAELARATYEQKGGDVDGELEKVRSWLAEHDA